MPARIAKFALASAIVVVAICVAGYLLSAPTDAAPSGPLARIYWQQAEQAAAGETQALMTGRDRPSVRPTRSDFEDPGRRVRSSSIEALLYRTEGRGQD